MTLTSLDPLVISPQSFLTRHICHGKSWISTTSNSPSFSPFLLAVAPHCFLLVLLDLSSSTVLDVSGLSLSLSTSIYTLLRAPSLVALNTTSEHLWFKSLPSPELQIHIFNGFEISAKVSNMLLNFPKTQFSVFLSKLLFLKFSPNQKK